MEADVQMDNHQSVQTYVVLSSTNMVPKGMKNVQAVPQVLAMYRMTLKPMVPFSNSSSVINALPLVVGVNVLLFSVCFEPAEPLEPIEPTEPMEPTLDVDRERIFKISFSCGSLLLERILPPSCDV